MGILDPRAVPEMLVGLAPTSSGACARCGLPTRALANGRGRIEICGGCGTLEVQSSEGLDVWSLRGTPAGLPRAVQGQGARPKRPDEALRLR